jgi:putative transposase
VGQNPTARGQTGTKRRVLTAGGGVPIGLAVEGATPHDCKITREPLESLPGTRPEPTPESPQGLGLDQGEAEAEGRALLAECGFTAHSRARGEKAHALSQEAGFSARRVVVERTPSGMHRCRRVLIRGDKNVRNEGAFRHVACASMTYSQAGLLG